MFKRRHHCRACGMSVCSSHSQGTQCISGFEQQQRVCDSCLSMDHTSTEPEPELLYSTHSICAMCSLVENRGCFEWREAQVVQFKGTVWLVIRCERHGKRWTKLSSNPPEFHKCLKMTNYAPWKDIWSSSTVDAALQAVAAAKQPSSGNNSRPLVIDLPIFKQGKFISDVDLVSSITHFGSLINSEQQFVLKLSGKLANNIEVLNQKVLLADSSMPPLCSVLLELTFERMIDLSRLPDSALLQARVYPVITMFVSSGQETEAVSQLKECVECLKDLSDMVVLVSLIVDHPFPDLGAILTYLRSQSRIVRFVSLTWERSTSQLFANVATGNSTLVAEELPPDTEGKPALVCGTADVSELIRSFEAATGLTESDFVSLATGVLLEPFLETLGHGTYCVRPSPFAGVATCLINTSSLHSVPVPRILDLEKLFARLAPVFVNGAQGFGIRQYAEVGLAVQDSVRDGYRLPDLISKIAEQGNSGKAGKVSQIMQNMQFILVQPPTDLFCVDLVSQCWPFVLTQQGPRPDALVRPNMGFF